MSAARADFDWYIRIVSESYGITEAEIKGRDRSRKATFCRRVMAIILREKGYSYPVIGDTLRRNHTSAMRLTKPYHHATYGRSSRTGKVVDMAWAEARKILSDRAVKIPQLDTEEPTCDFHEQWLEAVNDCAAAMPHQREEIWTDRCKRLFPWSWESQVAMPPRGVEW